MTLLFRWLFFGLNIDSSTLIDMLSENTPIMGAEVKSNTYYEMDESHESHAQGKKPNIFLRFLRKIYNFILKPPS